MRYPTIFLRVQLFTILAFFFAVSSMVCAQKEDTDKRERVIEAVKIRAKTDVETGKETDIRGLQLLFEQDAAAAGINFRELVQIYEVAHKDAKGIIPWWQRIRPSDGWITAIVLFILLIFRDSVQKTISGFTEKIKKVIYERFAGSLLFRGTATRKYKAALNRKYQKIIIPFRSDRPLRMQEVYVPLKIRGDSDNDLVDAHQTILKNLRTVIVGPPGSGKSMLLKKLALSYAEARPSYLSTSPIPIILELNRLNEIDRELKENLLEILSLNDFPGANNFLNNALEKGALVLLFDGLDEVNSIQRKSVVRKIKDFLEEYKNCRVVITCRNAVYRDDFAEAVDKTLEIVDFNDQQVRKFLESWIPYMPANKSIEQLIRTLRDRPQIMALARNPLLLTIIAFLYTDTEFVLPHSRAEFYRSAVDILLSKWQTGQNRFRPAQKTLVLQHLALLNQDRSASDRQDKRSIDLKLILQEIKKLLPDLNLAETEANSLLDEIVERSGLLLSIDGGAKFQFAHLTLQEFFASVALAAKPEDLLYRFRSDADTWRETIKLWCGLEHDSSDLIAKVYGDDPIVAFECLADAQKVRPDLADEIINFFKQKFGKNPESNEAIVKAFAALAADSRPRGKEVLAFLVETLTNPPDSLRETAAMAALSLTNSPQAAEILASYYATKPEVRPFLIRMGDLASPLLGPMVISGNRNALQDLTEIGTPYAANIITGLLWHENHKSAARAAMYLSILFSQPSIENELRDYQLPASRKDVQTLHGIWKPFAEPSNSSLPMITDRMAYLLREYAPYLNTIEKPSGYADPRILIPTIVESKPNFRDLYFGSSWTEKVYDLWGEFDVQVAINKPEWGKRGSFMRDILGHLSNPQLTLNNGHLEDLRDRVVKEGLRAANNRALSLCFELLEKEKRWQIFLVVTQSPVDPTMDDWTNVFRPTVYEFDNGLHFKSVLLLIFGISIMAVYRIIFILLKTPELFDWWNLFPVLALISIVASWLVCWRGIRVSQGVTHKPFSSIVLLIMTTGFFFFPLIFGILVTERNRLKDEDDVTLWNLLSMVAPGILFTPALLFYSSSFLLTAFSAEELVLFWSLFMGLVSILMIFGSRKARRAKNPLYGILESPKQTPTFVDEKLKWIKIPA